MPGTATSNAITERLLRSVVERLAENKRVRRALPMWGRLHIERRLPFLCVYRRPTARNDEGTDRLLTGEAAYMLASGDRRLRAGLSSLVRRVVETLSSGFESFLILEVWSGQRGWNEDVVDAGLSQPVFRIHAPKSKGLDSTIERFDRALRRIRILDTLAEVQVVRGKNLPPRGLGALLPPSEIAELGVHVLGLEVCPAYRDAENGQLFPLVHRKLHRSLSRAFKQCFFEFTRARTSQNPAHYHTLGRRSMVKAVWEVDRQLAGVGDAFDFLLEVTPVNTDAAWNEFRKSYCERAPEFLYRPSPIEPALLKRALYKVPLERVEDPVLAQLFREKQDELDRKITLLADRNTPRFLHGNLQLYGGVTAEEVQLAEDLLDRVPPRSRDDVGHGYLNSAEFAARAREEIEYYRERYPDFEATVELRDDFYGLLVTRGSLLVGRRNRFPIHRVEALLQHEIGTHLVTLVNGRAQPFRHLETGLAGYEELQEGLAVLAEYLVGGLSRPRVRILAARVIAIRNMVAGASFTETYRELTRVYGFGQKAAYNIAMRIYRGGGLTKDAIYLRGLSLLLQYLANGGDMELLFIGKIGADHVPIIRELRWRQILQPPPLLPRYMESPAALEKLNQVRDTSSLFDLIGRKR